MPTIRENINPALLTFSRQQMGYDIPVIAKKVSVNEERWLKWERGEEKPTTNQLITLADKLDRTPAFFYLELVPGEDAERVFNRGDLSVREIKRVSNQFRVSGYVMLIRLLYLDLITQKEYNWLEPEFSFYNQNTGGGDGGDPYYNRIVQKGRLYLKAAFQSYFNGQITVAELANLTGWKVPNLNELAAKIFDWAEEGQYV